MDFIKKEFIPEIFFDPKAFITSLCKYIVQGLVLAFCLLYIPKRSLQIKEIITLALVSASTFMLLDLFSPKVSEGVKFGIGFFTGGKMIGQQPSIF